MLVNWLLIVAAFCATIVHGCTTYLYTGTTYALASTLVTSGTAVQTSFQFRSCNPNSYRPVSTSNLAFSFLYSNLFGACGTTRLLKTIVNGNQCVYYTAGTVSGSVTVQCTDDLDVIVPCMNPSPLAPTVVVATSTRVTFLSTESSTETFTVTDPTTTTTTVSTQTDFVDSTTVVLSSETVTFTVTQTLQQVSVTTVAITDSITVSLTSTRTILSTFTTVTTTISTTLTTNVTTEETLTSTLSTSLTTTKTTTSCPETRVIVSVTSTTTTLVVTSFINQLTTRSFTITGKECTMADPDWLPEQW